MRLLLCAGAFAIGLLGAIYFDDVFIRSFFASISVISSVVGVYARPEKYTAVYKDAAPGFELSFYDNKTSARFMAASGSTAIISYMLMRLFYSNSVGTISVAIFTISLISYLLVLFFALAKTN